MCRGSQALATNRSIQVLLFTGWAGRRMVETMSGHFAAYLAIVGTLAFASAGAASAAQVNIPQINIPRPNIPRPQISVPTPRLTSPKFSTPNLVSRPTGTAPVSGSNTTTQYGHALDMAGRSPTGQPMPQQQSTTGTTSGNQFSNVSGGAGPSFRCRPKGGGSSCR